jgi:hypothetical protein
MPAEAQCSACGVEIFADEWACLVSGARDVNGELWEHAVCPAPVPLPYERQRAIFEAAHYLLNDEQEAGDGHDAAAWSARFNLTDEEQAHAYRITQAADFSIQQRTPPATRTER